MDGYTDNLETVYNSNNRSSELAASMDLGAETRSHLTLEPDRQNDKFLENFYNKTDRIVSMIYRKVPTVIQRMLNSIVKTNVTGGGSEGCDDTTNFCERSGAETEADVLRNVSNVRNSSMDTMAALQTNHSNISNRNSKQMDIDFVTKNISNSNELFGTDWTTTEIDNSLVTTIYSANRSDNKDVSMRDSDSELDLDSYGRNITDTTTIEITNTPAVVTETNKALTAGSLYTVEVIDSLYNLTSLKQFCSTRFPSNPRLEECGDSKVGLAESSSGRFPSQGVDSGPVCCTSSQVVEVMLILTLHLARTDSDTISFLQAKNLEPTRRKWKFVLGNKVFSLSAREMARVLRFGEDYTKDVKSLEMFECKILRRCQGDGEGKKKDKKGKKEKGKKKGKKEKKGQGKQKGQKGQIGQKGHRGNKEHKRQKRQKGHREQKGQYGQKGQKGQKWQRGQRGQKKDNGRKRQNEQKGHKVQIGQTRYREHMEHKG